MHMTGVPVARRIETGRSALSVPFQLDPAAPTQPGDEAFCWPVRFTDIAPVLEDLPNRYLALADELEDDETRFVLLGAISFLIATLGYVETAICLQAADEQGLAFDALPEAGQYLADEPAGAQLPLPFCVQPTVVGSSPPLSRLREWRITAKWNGMGALGALLRPDVIAISTSPLLKYAADAEHRSIAYRFQWNVFNARTAPGPAYHIDCDSLAERATAALVDPISLVSGVYRDRLRRLVRHEAELAFAITANHLSRLSGLRDMPKELWSGTGGHYASRLVGLEVLRRGGTARRFGHGLVAGVFYQRQKPFRVAEFAVSSEFSVPTRSFAETLERTGAMAGTPARFRPELHWGDGDSHFRSASSVRPRTGGGRRIRVLYAPTALRGNRQYLSPQLPDVIYRHWQHRLVDMLQSMPVELVYTLHVLDRAHARDHPCARIGTLAADGFEKTLGSVDVVLLDFLKSTTVGAVLPGSVPIVLVDLERLSLEPELDEALTRRCTVIRAEYDEGGRPGVDRDMLAEALCGPRGTPDADYFRNLYVGAAA